MKGHRGLTIVIKLGTSSIVHETTHEPRLSTLSVIVETAVKLRRDGHRVVLVSSGAIGVALQMMELERRPKSLPQVQALAALGQARLMSIWDRFFMHLKQPVAQILLTRNDIADRTQYLNAQNTMNELLNMGIIPIVNENDTLSVAEIKFGDNDTLSAITAAMLSADYLFLMTDVDCLYTENPRANPLATPITVVSDISALEADVSSAGSALGTGGMSTKIVAAKLATSAGVTTIITRSSKPGNVAEIVSHLETLKHAARTPGEPDGTIDPPAAEPPVSSPPLHTRFLPSQAPIRDRSFWLLHGLAPHGTVYIDEGAYRALRRKAGLLPAGVVGVEGHFSQQEAVRLVVMSSSRAETSALQSDPHLRSPISSQPSSRPPTRTSTHGGLAAYDHPSIESDMTSSTNSGSTAIATPTHSSSIPEKPSSRPASGADLQTVLNSTVLANAHAHTHGYTPSTATMPQREVGRALVNYAAPEVARIKGLQSADIASVLGYADSEYVALRENVSLFSGKDRKRGGRTGDGHDEAPEREDQVPPKLGDLGSFA